MLIIGHRGAAGLAPENTLESLKAAAKAGVDMLEFDVRVTADGIPILSHGARLHGALVRRTKFTDIGKKGSVLTLEKVLDTYFGVLMLNLEIKPGNNVRAILELLTDHYVKDDADWDNLIISGFRVRDLQRFRRISPNVRLALLHHINPFAFVTYQRRLGLAAVGWHRLYVNNLAIEIAKKTGLFTYVYTVNRVTTAEKFARRGIDGVVTDYPDRFESEL